MLLGLWIPVLFRHSKINHMDNVGCFTVGTADEEVVGLDVSVNEVLLVDGLHSGKLLPLAENLAHGDISGYHLLRNHCDCLDGESTVAMIKQIFQTRAQQIEDQNVVETFLTVVIHVRHTGCTAVRVLSRTRIRIRCIWGLTTSHQG